MALDLRETLRPVTIAGRPLPLVGRARIYACGVTPYDVTHLGHAATTVWVDVVVRLLRRLGTDAELCRNVTDVDQHLVAAARRAGAEYDRFAAVQQYYFDRDLAALGVTPPTHEPRARTHIREVIALAAGLVDRGAAYVRDGTVYFRGAGVPDRAGLSHDEAIALLTEYDDEPGDPRKDDPLDVTVWQAARPDEPAWPSPWGDGRPGWHAECTAMVLSTFGPAIDLHAGGADLRFPHHAYEAAQGEAITGVAPFSRGWLHVGTVRLDGHKMAKSAGNLVLVSDLLHQHSAAAIRLLLLRRSWSQPWDYDPAELEAAATALEALYSGAGRGGDGAAEAAVLDALRADLDVRRALDIATDAGGAAARTLVEVLNLR
jgi:cysteinyl-tRNA synthetase